MSGAGEQLVLEGVAQLLQCFRLLAQVEKGLHLGGVGFRTYDFGPPSGPEHQLESIHQDRLPRPGLPGHDVEPAIELDLERLDDREAPDAQARQHGRSCSTGVAWALQGR